jgi:hypothetical protein
VQHITKDKPRHRASGIHQGYCIRRCREFLSFEPFAKLLHERNLKGGVHSCGKIFWSIGVVHKLQILDEFDLAEGYPAPSGRHDPCVYSLSRISRSADRASTPNIKIRNSLSAHQRQGNGGAAVVHRGREEEYGNPVKIVPVTTDTPSRTFLSVIFNR